MTWHVLIVEDEQDSREIVQTMLTMNGMETDVASSAEEALQLLDRNHYHAAVIDLMLPGMDGLDLARSIRSTQKTAHLPCIAITAYGSGALRRQAAEAGYDLYYAKPVAQDDLFEGIQRLVK